MVAIFGRGVSAIYQIQGAFAQWPAGGEWVRLDAYERSEGETRPREIDPLLGSGGVNNRDPVASAPGLNQGGGQIQAPLCMRQLGYWLCATFGAPETSEDAGVFTHVWESGKDVLASLAQSKRMASGMFRRTRGLTINTLAINAAKEAGYPRVTLGAMLRDEALAEAEATGDVVTLALLRQAASRWFVKRNGAEMAATAVTFNYSNQLERYDPLSDTDGEYPAALDPGDSLPTGSFTTRYESTVYDLLADAATPQPYEFGQRIQNAFGPGKHASWSARVNNAVLDKGPLPVTAPGRLFQTQNFTAEQSDEAPAVTFTLVNDVEGYPPPPPPPPPPPGP